MAVELMGDTHEIFKFKSWGVRNAMLWLMQEATAYILEIEGGPDKRVVENVEFDENDSCYIIRLTLQKAYS